MTLENAQLRFRLGDTWASDEWAVLVDDQPVDLSVGGWVVRAQARRRWDDDIIVEWSTQNSRIQLGFADVAYGDTGQVAETSTVQMKHSASESDAWDPFSTEFELEIERGSGSNVERYTVVSGRVTGFQDLADT